MSSSSLEEEEAESSSGDAADKDDDESSNGWRRRLRWALPSLLAAFLKLSRVSWSYQSSSLRSLVMAEDGVTVSTTVAVEKATDFCLRRGGDTTSSDVRCLLRQQLAMWNLSLGVGAVAEVVAPTLLTDEEADGSASALRWKGLGEIIGEADEELLGTKVDDGDRDVRDVLVTLARNVAAPAATCNACGRRLVFLVTHICFADVGSSRIICW